MSDPFDAFDREWHRIVAEKDRAGLERVLAEDVTLDEQGTVVNLDVLMRPANAISELRGVIAHQMAAFLEERAAQREDPG